MEQLIINEPVVHEKVPARIYSNSKEGSKAVAIEIASLIQSNQKTNAYLKEIAACCGITKELTFHVARHTFATTVTLTNGVPIESVSKMPGHKKMQTTQHYAKILDKRVSYDMQTLRVKFQPKLRSVTNKKNGLIVLSLSCYQDLCINGLHYRGRVCPKLDSGSGGAFSF